MKGPSRDIWKVSLVRRSDQFVFGDGWKGFVADQSLAMGDFLLFRYDGNSRFKVLVFDSTACEKKEAFLARPNVEEGNMVVEENNEYEEDVRVKEEEEEENKPLVHFAKRRLEWILKKKGGISDRLATNDHSKKIEKKKKKEKQFQFDMDQSNSKKLMINSGMIQFSMLFCLSMLDRIGFF